MPTHTWRVIVATMLALGVLFGCVVVFVLWQITREHPLPFAYEDITPVNAYPRQLCPGDALTFDLRVTVEDAPSVVAVVENWQSGLARALPDLEPAYFVQERAKIADSRQSVTVPDLAPGDWSYERAGAVDGVHTPALLQIAFAVREDCR